MREYPGPLFRPNAKGADSTYTFLRDHPRAASDRELAEGLWTSYWPFADTEFYNDIPGDFAARFWEMDLACGLLRVNFRLQERLRHGPDVCVGLGDRRLWLEAVSPTDGSGPNASSDLHYDLQARTFEGEDGILLRFRGSIEEKLNRYLSYCDDRIIELNEPYVIALNGSRVSASIIEADLPWPVKAVYPFGTTRVHIDLESEAVSTSHDYRPSIQTAAKSPVATDIFLQPKYVGISGILYSRADLRNRRDDFIFVHNTGATNPLPRGWLPVGAEYWPDRGALQVTRHSGDRPE